MKKSVRIVIALAIVLVLLAVAAFVLGILESGKSCVHTYGTWSNVNENMHKHICSLCGEEEEAQHTWNQGAVTKEATCKEPGQKTYTCTGCGTEKTEQTLALTQHTYDHDCDADCNICGQTRQTSHTAGEIWGKDPTNHWKECTQCQAQLDLAEHTPGPAATEEIAQTCTICGYTIQPALNHEHSYATSWTVDRTGHWHSCAGCEEMKDYARHSYDNSCDPDCNTCGYTRIISHSYSKEWVDGLTGHWHVCSVCGAQDEEQPHVPGKEATATTPQLCTVCQWEIAPALGGGTAGETTTPTTRPSQGGQTSEMTYEWYMSLSGDEQQAFYASFADPLDFFDWHAAAKEEYEKNQNDIIIGEDGVIDLEDLLNGRN